MTDELGHANFSFGNHSPAILITDARDFSGKVLVFVWASL